MQIPFPANSLPFALLICLTRPAGTLSSNYVQYTTNFSSGLSVGGAHAIYEQLDQRFTRIAKIFAGRNPSVDPE